MNEKYLEYNTNRTALIKETLLLLNKYVAYKSWKKVGLDVYEDNILMKSSKAMQDKIYGIIKKRYLGQNSDFEITPFIKIVTSDIRQEIKAQCIYYEFCSKDPLVFDITTKVLFERYKNGYNSISKEHIENFLKMQQNEHPELKEWAVTTRARFIRHYLSTMKEFGLLKGKSIKEFIKQPLFIETFIFVIYSIAERTKNSREIINSVDWNLFLMDSSDVKVLLKDATKEGFLIFEEKGNISNIIFQHKNLEEASNAITRK